MNREPFRPETPDKLSVEEKQKIAYMFDRIKKEIPDLQIEETPDTITVKQKDEEGKETAYGFTKVGDKLQVGSEWYYISDVIEARLKFPGENLETALENLKKGKD